MMTIRELINRELDSDEYSYIELYDIDTEMPIYKGLVWDCPYDMNYIVKDYQIYNINNKVSFTIWIDFAIWEVEEAIDKYMCSLNEENIIVHGEEEDFFFYVWEEPELI